MPPAPPYHNPLRDWPHDGDTSYLESLSSPQLASMPVQPLSDPRRVVSAVRMSAIVKQQGAATTVKYWWHDGTIEQSLGEGAPPAAYKLVGGMSAYIDVGELKRDRIRLGLDHTGAGGARATQAHLELFYHDGDGSQDEGYPGPPPHEWLTRSTRDKLPLAPRRRGP